MPALHMEGFLKVAQEKNLVIGIRPVSKFAEDFILAGYPTKPFAVKNKTSNLGITAGLLSISPVYSPIALDRYDEYHAMLNDAYIKDTSLEPIPLFLSEERILNLQFFFNKDDFVVTKTAEDPICYSISWKKNTEFMQAYAVRYHDAFQILDINKEPIMVLGKSFMDESGILVERPITSDFDLLVVCPLYSDFDPAGLDKTPLDAQSKAQHSPNAKCIHSEVTFVEPTENEKGGNWSPRIASTVNYINHIISQIDPLRRVPELKTVHHNAEFTNPFANKIESCFPALLVFPKPMDLSELPIAFTPSITLNKVDVILLESVSDLIIIRDFLREQGYSWPNNLKYKDVIPAFNHSVIAAAEQGIKLLEQRQPKCVSSLFFNLHINTIKTEQSTRHSNSIDCGCV